MYCTKCGAKLAPEARFCRTCGRQAVRRPSRPDVGGRDGTTQSAAAEEGGAAKVEQRAPAEKEQGGTQTAPAEGGRASDVDQSGQWVPLSMQQNQVHGGAAPAQAPIKKGKGAGRKILSLALVLIAVFGIYFAVRLFGEMGDDLFKTGTLLTEEIKAGESRIIGDIHKTGWAVEIEEGTFDEDVEIVLDVSSLGDTSAVTAAEGNLVGGLVKINAKDSAGEDVVYLEKPVTISMRIPKAKVKLLKKEMNFYAVGCLVEGEWVLVHPDATNLAEGIVTFQTDHFTPFATISMEEQKLIKKLAEDYAKREWSKGTAKDQIMARLDLTFRDVFQEVGVTDSQDQKKLLNKIKLHTNFDRLMTKLEEGKEVDLSQECANITSDVLVTSYTKFPGSNAIPYVGSVPNMVEGTNQLLRGDYGDAAINYTKAVAKLFPPTKILNSAIEGVQFAGTLSRDWDRFSGNVAFIAYKNHIGENGRSIDFNDPEWKTVIGVLYGNDSKAKKQAVKEYATQKGLSVSDVEKNLDTGRIFEDFNKRLIGEYWERYQLDKELISKQAEHMKIVEGFMKAGFFERGTMGFDSGTSLQERVDELFAHRVYILDLFGGKMPVLSLGESSENNLHEAILNLIHAKGDIAKFMEWLDKKGYITGSLKEDTPDQEGYGGIYTGKSYGKPVLGGDTFELLYGALRIEERENGLLIGPCLENGDYESELQVFCEYNSETKLYEGSKFLEKGDDWTELIFHIKLKGSSDAPAVEGAYVQH
ncbi:MAG: zinc ribbon domain-containing protein, partial [Alkaliphilus sp.]|nr:zinc ribbon domain-containing protein [Alkaliphilus sp.]